MTNIPFYFQFKKVFILNNCINYMRLQDAIRHMPKMLSESTDYSGKDSATPDNIVIYSRDGKDLLYRLNYSTSQAFPFLWYDGELLVGDYRDTHHDTIVDYISNEGEYSSQYKDDNGSYITPNYDDDKIEGAGRIFETHEYNFIMFWEYRTDSIEAREIYKELDNVLYEYFDLNIDDYIALFNDPENDRRILGIRVKDYVRGRNLMEIHDLFDFEEGIFNRAKLLAIFLRLFWVKNSRKEFLLSFCSFLLTFRSVLLFCRVCIPSNFVPTLKVKKYSYKLIDLSMELKKIATICLLGVSVLANAERTHMTVELKAGSKYSFLLADKPVLTYKNMELVVNGEAATSYAIDDVKKYYFTDSETAGSELLDGNLPTFNITDSKVDVTNATPSQKVSLLAANGIVLENAVVNEGGNATLTLPQAKGIYVLVVGNQSFKIVRK